MIKNKKGQIDPKSFWEKKLLGWEKNRYELANPAGTFLEKLAGTASNSLRFRLEITKKILFQNCKNKTIVEFGCGSALLAEPLIEAGAKRFIGYDFASDAINRARERIKKNGLDEKISLISKNVLDLTHQECDIVFSLGFLDWLDLREIEHIYEIQTGADWLHAISEQKISLSQSIHKAYVYLSYGHKTGNYVPKYYSVSEIECIAKRHNSKVINVFRHKRLSFGAILHTLSYRGQGIQLEKHT